MTHAHSSSQPSEGSSQPSEGSFQPSKGSSQPSEGDRPPDAERVQGIYHVGLTVRDIERSIAFYCDVLGMQLAWRQESTTPYIAHLTGLPGTHLLVAYLKPRDAAGPFIELLQYLAPEGTPVDTRPCNPGNAHVCFFVDDLAASYDRLRAQDVPFVSPPVRITAGVHAGSSTVYARDPDGITLEFFERRAS